MVIKYFRLWENEGAVDIQYRKILTFQGTKYQKSLLEYHARKGGSIKGGNFFEYEEIDGEEYNTALEKYKSN